jgi:hypothetical protein
MSKTLVNMLWIGGDLSNIELLSINSFLKNDYAVNLWTYQPITNIPDGVMKNDANLIIPEDEIFKVRGSVAPFSDIFRLKLINEQGGMWSDIDVVALKPAEDIFNSSFVVTEDIWEGSWRKDKPYTITNCVIYNSHSEPGNLIDVVYNFASTFPKEKIAWSTIGPDALHNISDIYPDHGFDIKPVVFANSIPAGKITEVLLNPGDVDPDAQFLHLYNDMWRRQNLNKNAKPPQGSILDGLYKKYFI